MNVAYNKPITFKEPTKPPRLTDKLLTVQYCQTILGQYTPTNPEPNFHSSYMDAIHQIFAKLRIYGYDPATFVGSKAIFNAHRNAQRQRNPSSNFGHGHSSIKVDQTRTNLIYCRRCMRNDLSLDGYNMCVIAKVEGRGLFPKRNENDDRQELLDGVTPIYSDGTVNIGLTVIDVYPHSIECNKHVKYRKNILLDSEFNGRGWAHIKQFPQEEIFRDTYLNTTECLNLVDVHDLDPPGHRIQNVTKIYQFCFRS